MSDVLPTDLVSDLVKLAEAERDIAYSVDMKPEDTANWKYALTALRARDEIERLKRERSEWAGIAATRNRNIARIADERDRLRTALESFVKIAAEAATEWDNDNDPRVGKLLLAMSGHVHGYRADIDAIHAAMRRAHDVGAHDA